MATPTSSGVVGSFNLRVSDIIEKAARRCGVTPDRIGFEAQSILTENLWMILSYMSTRGINLWRLYRPLFGLYPGQRDYTLNVGDIQIVDPILRMPQALDGTVTSSGGGTVSALTDRDIASSCVQGAPGGSFVWDFGSGSSPSVAMVGLLPVGSSTYSLAFDVSPDANAWKQVYAQGSAPYVDGAWQWIEFDPAIAGRYFRIRETGTGTLAFYEAFVSERWQDIALGMLNHNTYMNYPDKRGQSSRPTMFYFEKLITPVVHLLPVPNYPFNLMAPLVHRHIEDVGDLSNVLNIPQRFVPQVILDLALLSISELPGADLKRIGDLKGERDELRFDIETDDVDHAPIDIMPDISVYTK